MWHSSNEFLFLSIVKAFFLFGVCLLFPIELNIIVSFTHSKENCPNDTKQKSFSIWLTLPYYLTPFFNKATKFNIKHSKNHCYFRFHCVPRITLSFTFFSRTIKRKIGCSLKLHCIGNSVVEQIVKIMSVAKAH